MMAYQNNFVVSILQNQKTIRESSDGGSRICKIAFDSEYVIRLKNKTKRRAYASISVDGMDISPGRRFVLKPGETVDVERFLSDGNLNEGKKFKFMSLAKGSATGEIQDPTSEENGNIVVTFDPEIPGLNDSYRGGSWSSSGDTTLYGTKLGGGGILRGMAMGGFNINAQTNGGTAQGDSSNNFLVSNCVQGTATGDIEGLNAHINSLIEGAEILKNLDKGATAEGSHSNQKFTNSYDYFLTTTPVVLKLQLRGILRLGEPEFQPTNSYMPTQIVINQLYKIMGEEDLAGCRKALKALIQDYESRIP